jgi:hypothetical protein
LCSYLSLRLDEGTKLADRLERVGDICFMLGLVSLTAIIFLFAYEVI